MKDLKVFFAILPILYAVIGLLLLLNGWFWMGVLLFFFSTAFGMLFFGMIFNRRN